MISADLKIYLSGILNKMGDRSKQNPNVKDVSAWTQIDDRHKPKKLTKGEPTTYEQDLDNLREHMRRSCDKGTCNWK